MSGGAKFFIDTNLLLYSIDKSDHAKWAQARAWIEALWAAGAGRLSWQVLHEFYANLPKIRTSNALGRQQIESLLLWQPLDTSHDLIGRAWHWQDTAQISYWDGLIVAAAERLECSWLVSEDFQTGRKFGNVTVVNQFLSGPDEFELTPA